MWTGAEAPAGITSAHVDKLAHPIREIRERALRQLVAKLACGLELDDELARTRQLVEVLLGWWRYEEPSLQGKVLQLLLDTIKSKAGAYIIKETGTGEILRSLERIRGKVDADAESIYEDIVDTLRFLDTVQSEHNIHVPRLNIPSTSSSEQSGDAKRWFGWDGFNVGSSGGSTFNSDDHGLQMIRSTMSPIRVLLLPWIALTPADRKTLVLMEDALQLVRSTRRCCRFIKDVFVRDFPAEVFLNRPALVKKLSSLLSSSGRCGQLLEVSLAITNAVHQRIRQLSCPELKHCNTEATDNVTSSHDMTQQLASQLDCDINVNDLRHSDDSGAVLNQLPVPYYCLDTLVELLKAMARSLVVIGGGEQEESFGVAELNIALTLVDKLIGLLVECVDAEFWQIEHNTKTYKDVAHKSFIMMRLTGEIINKLRVSWQSVPARTHHRVAMLRLVISGLRLTTWSAGGETPHNLIVALQPILADMPVILMYKELNLEMLQNSRLLLNEDFSKKHKEVIKLCAAIDPTTRFLRDNSTHDTKSVIAIIKSSLPTLELHNSEAYLKDTATILLKSLKDWTLDDAELSDARKIILTLMAHPQEWVRVGFYKMMAETVVGVLTGERTEIDEKSLHVLFDVGILTELCCHGLSSKNKQVLASATDLVVYLMRGRLVLSEHCWWKLLSSLLPVLPLLHCYAEHDTLLGEAIMHSLETRISECMGVSRGDLVAGCVRLLFMRCPAARAHSAHILCGILHDDEDSEQYLPTQEMISSEVLLTALQRVEPAEFNVDLSTSANKNVQTAGLIQMLDLLKQDMRFDESPQGAFTEEPTLEPSLRRSTLQRLAVVMQQPGLHDAFESRDGVKLVCEHLRLSLLVGDYLTFPECAKSCVSVLNGLSFTSTTVRQALAKQDMMPLLIRVILVFPTDTECVRLTAQLLCTLAYAGFALQELGSNRRRVLSLPHCVVQRSALPFAANSYWSTSTNTVHSPAEWILSDDIWKSYLRHRWSHSWYGPRILRWAYPPPAPVPFPRHLLLTVRDLDMLKASSPLQGSLAALMAVQNASTHRAVDAGLGMLIGYAHLLRFTNVDMREYAALPWLQSLGRFLNSSPASPRDVALLTKVLRFIIAYQDNVDATNPETLAWLTGSVLADNGITSLLHKRCLYPEQSQSETLEVAQLQTSVVRVLVRCAVLGTGAARLEPLLSCLEGLDAKDFHLLGYRNELTRCVRYLLCRPQCLSRHTKMQAWHVLVASVQSESTCAGFKGQGSLLDVMLGLTAIVDMDPSDGNPQEWLMDNGQGSEGDFLSLVGACAARGQVQLRAAALHLFAGLARYSQILHLLDQGLESQGASCVEYAMRVLCDASEASVVRSAAATLLVNVTTTRTTHTQV